MAAYVYRGGIYRDNTTLSEWLSLQEPEPVQEPDLPIVDPHHHFWEMPRRGRYLLHEFRYGKQCLSALISQLVREAINITPRNLARYRHRL